MEGSGGKRRGKGSTHFPTQHPLSLLLFFHFFSSILPSSFTPILPSLVGSGVKEMKREGLYSLSYLSSFISRSLLPILRLPSFFLSLLPFFLVSCVAKGGIIRQSHPFSLHCFLFFLQSSLFLLYFIFTLPHFPILCFSSFFFTVALRPFHVLLCCVACLHFFLPAYFSPLHSISVVFLSLFCIFPSTIAVLSFVYHFHAEKEEKYVIRSLSLSLSFQVYETTTRLCTTLSSYHLHPTLPC